MANAKIDNHLYQHLKSGLNKALPLEYAIRATKVMVPAEFRELISLDEEIRSLWIDKGVSNEEIDSENLMDHSWDLLQLGQALSRTHGRIYKHQAFLELIHRTLDEIVEKYSDKVSEIKIPTADRFRYCDLINGNDIEKVLDAVINCIKHAQGYTNEDEIPIEKFVRFIRQPIQLYPGSRYALIRDEKLLGGAQAFALCLDFTAEYDDIKMAVDEYLYQYAKLRENHLENISRNDTTTRLIDDFLTIEYSDKSTKKEIKRFDGFLSIVTGILCWDTYRKLKNSGAESASLEAAICTTLNSSNPAISSYDDETIKKNYKKINKKISSIVESYENIAPQKHRRK